MNSSAGYNIHPLYESTPIVEAVEVGRPVWNMVVRYYPDKDVFRFEVEGEPGWIDREVLLKMVIESARLGERIEEKEEDEDE